MAKKPKASKSSVRITGVCELFATMPMVCPLCHLTIPASTPHKCERKE